MKVAELRLLLNELDGEMEVVTNSHCCGHDWFGPEDIEIQDMYSYDESFGTGAKLEFRMPYMLIDPDFDLDEDDHPRVQQFKALVVGS